MTAAEPGTDRLLVADLVGLLGRAEDYNGPGSRPGSRLDYLERRAALLHRLVDAVGDESSRYLAQDAQDVRVRGPGTRVRRPAARIVPAAVNAQAPRKS
ncbi:hypothetical protein [Streptomyces sp. NPDC053720]|uniref:hypothetical protein n=1 Tax=Streptomyces sp. NPDC053720 TaxID=3154855 RepID=UPI003428702F